MHWYDWALLAVIALLLIVVIRYLKKHKGCHGSCCEGCQMKSCCEKAKKK